MGSDAKTYQLTGTSAPHRTLGGDAPPPRSPQHIPSGTRPAVPRPRPARARPPAKPVRAKAPDNSVPAELEAAVIVPDAQSISGKTVEASRTFFPSPEASPDSARSEAPAESVKPRSGPPPLPRKSPLPDLVLDTRPPLARRSPPPLPRTSPPSPALPNAAALVERTPRPTTLSIELEASKPRRRFGTGIALALVATAIAAAGVTLVNARGVASVVAFLAPAPSARTVSPAPVVPAAAVELSARNAGVAEGARNEAPPAIATALPSDSTEIPVSNVTTPSCQQALGNGFVEKLDPVGAATENQVGHRALVRGDMDAAHAAFCKAALWDGGTIERRLNLANLYLLRRDGKQAVDAAARALELDPKNGRALEIQADAWARLGKPAEARRAYLAAEQRSESDEDAAMWLVRRDLDAAQRSLKARDYVRAEKLFLRVVVFEPEHEVATFGIATCLQKLNDHAGAEAWTRRAEALASTAGK